ncbi:MAG: hypothetical protein IKJ83_03565 [Ruminococcus sp.]|nr:hypothetical protein [Ruminococcus sp.]
MKKLLALLLSLLVIFALCACKKAESEDAHNHNHTHTHISETVHTEDTQPSETAEVTEAPEPSEDITDIETTASNTTGISDKVNTEGHYKQNHINKIDVPCEDELSKAQTVSDRISIFEKYAQEWTKVADRYYNELLKINGSVPATADYNTAQQMHEYLEFYKQDWELNFEQETKALMDKKAESEDKMGIDLIYSQLCYESRRELALYFIDIYEEIEDYSNQGY